MITCVDVDTSGGEQVINFGPFPPGLRPSAVVFHLAGAGHQNEIFAFVIGRRRVRADDATDVSTAERLAAGRAMSSGDPTAGAHHPSSLLVGIDGSNFANHYLCVSLDNAMQNCDGYVSVLVDRDGAGDRSR
jgi:hypothetical protein